jgi:hypothetical protein
MNATYVLEAGSVSRCLPETLVSVGGQGKVEFRNAYRVCEVEKGGRGFPVLLGLRILLGRIEGRWHRG